MRALYGLNRFSEEMDFSLLKPIKNFDIDQYLVPVRKEAQAFGFEIDVEKIKKTAQTPIQSAFLKADTRSQLLIIETRNDIFQVVPKGKILKIKLEVDIDPPSGFATNTKYLLNPIPFAVRAFELPDLFAGKMHAILCRSWKRRVKGRDWYDLIWYAARYPELHLSLLEERMRQTGHWKGNTFNSENLIEMLKEKIDIFDINQARKEVEQFIKDPENLSIWSREFFHDLVSRIKFV